MGGLGRAPVGVSQGPTKRGFSESSRAYGGLNARSRRDAPLAGEAAEAEGSVCREIPAVPVVEDVFRCITHVFG